MILSGAESEVDLIRLAVKGDEGAFTALYDTYADRIYRFVRLRVSDAGSAEDLTSLVFIKAWQKLADFTPRGASFRAWLYRIARNVVIDHYRTAKESISLDEVAGQVFTENDAPDQRLEELQETERVWQAMQEITDDQRQVLVLRFVDGLTTREIASVMGKREGAIRALQMRGLQALNEQLER